MFCVAHSRHFLSVMFHVSCSTLFRAAPEAAGHEQEGQATQAWLRQLERCAMHCDRKTCTIIILEHSRLANTRSYQCHGHNIIVALVPAGDHRIRTPHVFLYGKASPGPGVMCGV